MDAVAVFRAGALCGLGLAGAAVAAIAAPDSRGLDPDKAVTQYALDVWATENGLPQNTVNAFEQTPDGYLWLGTYEGLARFDGLRFTVFHAGNTDALKDNGIRALSRDRDGALWIGTNGGGLARYADGRFTHFSPGPLPGDDMVWALEAHPQGGMWVGTNAGTLYHFRDGAFETVLSGAHGESVYAILPGRGGTLWVGTHGGGLKRRSADGSWTHLTTESGLPSDFVRALHEDAAGRLWIGTLGGGLARREPDGRVTTFSRKDGLPDDVVSAIVEDRRGSLWIGTRRGLSRWRGGEFQTLGTTEGLPHAVVYAVYEDREGSLWIGTGGAGAARLRDGSFTVHTTREGLADDFVYPIHEDPQGRVWVGTSGGLSRFEGGTWTSYRAGTGLCHDVVRSLWVGAAGEVWVGTYGGGVCVLERERWTHFGSPDGLADDNVRAVLGTRDGSVWAGTVAGLSRRAAGAWRTYTTTDGLPTNSIICLHEDPRGDVWVGTDGGGLARFREGRFRVFGRPEGLPSGVVLAIAGDADGSLWIGTSGGLARLHDRRFTTFTTAAGLPGDAVHQILDDGQGHLWIGGSRGVYRLSKQELLDQGAGRRPRVAPLLLGRSDGLRSLQCTAPAQPAGFRTRDGRLWFATARGVAVLDPGLLRLDVEPPPVAVETVTAGDRTYPGDDVVVLDPGARRLSFRYTGLSLQAPDKVSFRHRLVGFDEDWIDAGDRRTADYTGLPPGEYRFLVTARAGTGEWNPTPAELRLALRPYFHQTRWFYLAVGVGVAALALAAHRLRVARLHARHRELSRLVAERTRSLHEEKERAEAARQEAERQTRIVAEADALKTEVLGIAAHDLKNPLQAVLSATDLLSYSTEPGVAQQGELIQVSALRMFGLVNDLMATAVLEGKVELRRELVDLRSAARAVVDDYQASARRKQQRLAFEGTAENCLAVGDPDRLRDVVDNLVSNAVKYSPPGGAIRVSVGSGHGTARLEVADHGPGLTAADQERMFGRFQRLSARPTGGEPTTGLGLFIVRRLVELMGGRVWAESDGTGHGARFIVELPQPGSADPGPDSPPGGR